MQPLTYVLEYWETGSKSTSIRASWVRHRSGPENAAEIVSIMCKWTQESTRQTKPKKGPERKVHEFRPFL